jgi:replicative DNA helicase
MRKKTEERVPPYDITLEQAVLGCILLDPNYCMGDLAERFKDEMEAFYDLRHQEIFAAMRDLHRLNHPIDVVTLHSKLLEKGKSEACGGITYLAALPDAASTAANVGYYAEKLEEFAVLRKIISVCTQAVQGAMEPEASSEEVLSQCERLVLAIRRQKPDRTPGIATLIRGVMDEIERCNVTQGALRGISTGYPDLDDLTDGLHPGEVVVLAGFPSAGKSAFAMNIAEHVSIDQKIATGVFSLEMSARRLVYRMIASRSQVNMRTIKKGTLSDNQLASIVFQGGKIGNSPIHFCDLSDMNIFQLRARARRMVQEFGIKFLVIDYLQLLSGQNRRDQNREQEISGISRGIKLMASELEIPVIVLSQLNDDGKLRESRSIGQDADGVWVLMKEEGDLVRLDLRKQRDGEAPAKVSLRFEKTNVRFVSVARFSEEEATPPWKSSHPDP